MTFLSVLIENLLTSVYIYNTYVKLFGKKKTFLYKHVGIKTLHQAQRNRNKIV